MIGLAYLQEDTDMTMVSLYSTTTSYVLLGTSPNKLLLLALHIKYKWRLVTTFINSFSIICKNLTIRQYFISSKIYATYMVYDYYKGIATCLTTLSQFPKRFYLN